MLRALLAYHLEQIGHFISSPILAVLGMVSLVAAETLPGENTLLRLGFAAAAITALAMLTKRTLRFIRGVDKRIDDWQETTKAVQDIPALKNRVGAIKDRQDTIVEQQAKTAARLDALDRGQLEILRRIGGDEQAES